MKSFKSYITEARTTFVKGWTKKGKIVYETSQYEMYHIKQVIKFASKFGLNKKKILKVLEDSGNFMDAPDPKEYAEEEYENLLTGKRDNDVYLEEYLQKKGFCMFVIDKTHGSVTGWDEKSCKLGAKALDDKYLPFEIRKNFKLFEIKLVRWKGHDKFITNKFDWNNWLEGKKTGSKRSEIGSTMSQFREDKEIYPKSYLKNRQLMDLVKKHKDPIKFLLAVIGQMNRGKLNLKRIGAASTREVAALWNDYNAKKIPENMVEEFIKNHRL